MSSKLHGVEGGFIIFDDLADDMEDVVCDHCGLPISRTDPIYHRPTTGRPLCRSCYVDRNRFGGALTVDSLNAVATAMDDMSKAMHNAIGNWASLFSSALGAALGAGIMGALPATFAAKPIAIGQVYNTPSDLKTIIESLCVCASCSGKIVVTPKVIAWAAKHEDSNILCETCIDKEAAGCSNQETRRRHISI